MADSTITGLSAVTAPASTDVTVIVNSSTTKKITIANLVANSNPASLTISGLTAGRVTYAGTAGLLSDDSGFTYNSGTHALTATTFVGALTGIASGNTLVSIVPNTTPTAGQLHVGNAGGTAFGVVSMSGDATLASTGAITLASTISAGGPTGSATVAPIITYDAKGRLTTVTSATITPAVGSITGLGTGVATALAVNVGSAGAFVTFNGAGGTPSSIVLTNATGTAASLTAGTASAVAASGITGTTLASNVVTTSITSVGILTAHTVSGQLLLTNDGTQGFQIQPTTATNAAFGTYVNTGGTAYLGTNSSGGNSNATGAAYAFVIRPASGKAIEFHKGDDTATPMTIANGGGITFSTNITTATGTPGSLCYNTSTFEMTKNNALTCTVSASEFKTGIVPLTDGLDVLLKMNPAQFAYKDDPKRFRWGFVADDLQAVNSKLADGYDIEGQAKSIDHAAIMAINTKALQELNDKVEILEKRILVLSEQVH